jgi:1-acyl-sn-glycerol-3-phosphate acyltransferase
LWLIGWRVAGELPLDVPRWVLIVAPHTSNWDFPIGLACAHALGLVVHWPYGFMAKASVFHGPMGWFMRAVGGIPIDRSRTNNLVDDMAAVLQQRERLMLVITPEGTRKQRPYWKSGFYHIALKAGVPIGMAAIDYSTRTGRIGPLFMPSGNVEEDLARIRAFFPATMAKYPEQASAIQFKE